MPSTVLLPRDTLNRRLWAVAAPLRRYAIGPIAVASESDEHVLDSCLQGICSSVTGVSGGVGCVVALVLLVKSCVADSTK